QLPDDQLLQLKTAALMHDTGLMFARENHEDLSVKYLQKTLPQYGFALDSIEIISALVMATKMPQQPQSFLAQLLCDADLDYLGSTSYFMKSQQLRLEWLED
ncbi:HD domain-containing protein, partial [Arthrospira platensis SPKY1]|nr:HD domain-containing protein [Arthrospira platensis SPKY1]